VQATARDITLIEHGNRIAEAWPVVLVVHDEIVCSVPENDAERCLAHMRQVMETPPKWCAALPLGAEGDIADNYAEAK
jgi:DNA polymerase I-like protein with 3'-5' exonuclease and polymerase domains